MANEFVIKNGFISQGTSYVSNGNLGINTSNPNYQLEVLPKDLTGTTEVVIRNTSSSDVRLSVRDGSNYGTLIQTAVGGLGSELNINSSTYSSLIQSVNGLIVAQLFTFGNSLLWRLPDNFNFRRLSTNGDWINFNSLNQRVSIFNENIGGVTIPSRLGLRGDTNTSSSYSLVIQNSGGTNSLVVRDDGNVGIGTATPTAKLEVKSNSSTGNTVYPFSINKQDGPKVLYLSNENYYANPNNLGVYSEIYDELFNINLVGSSGQFKLNYGDSTFQLNPYPNAFGTRFLFKTNPGGGSGEAGIAHIFNGNPTGGNNQYIISEDLQVGTTTGGTGTTIVGKYIRKNNFNNPTTTFYPLIVMDGNVGFGTSTPTSKLDVNLGGVDGSTIAIQTRGSIPSVIGDRTTFSVNNNGRLTAGNLISLPSSFGHSFATPIGSTNAFNVHSNDYSQGLFFVNTDGSFSLGNGVQSGAYFESNGTNTFRFYGANSGQSQKVGINGGIPTASLHVVGSDSTSSNYGLKVQNSGGTDNFVVRNDGYTLFNNSAFINNNTSPFQSLLSGDFLGTLNNNLNIVAGINTPSSNIVRISYYGNTQWLSALSIQNSGALFGNLLLMPDGGNVGIGTSTPTSNLDVSGSTGYNQLRMRTSFTPSGSTDINGNVGDIAWDDTYFYWKTSTQWLRISGETF